MCVGRLEKLISYRLPTGNQKLNSHRDDEKEAGAPGEKAIALVDV